MSKNPSGPQPPLAKPATNAELQLEENRARIAGLLADAEKAKVEIEKIRWEQKWWRHPTTWALLISTILAVLTAYIQWDRSGQQAREAALQVKLVQQDLTTANADLTAKKAALTTATIALQSIEATIDSARAVLNSLMRRVSSREQRHLQATSSDRLSAAGIRARDAAQGAQLVLDSTVPLVDDLSIRIESTTPEVKAWVYIDDPPNRRLIRDWAAAPIGSSAQYDLDLTTLRLARGRHHLLLMLVSPVPHNTTWRISWVGGSVTFHEDRVVSDSMFRFDFQVP